jgi:putative hemolysin
MTFITQETRPFSGSKTLNNLFSNRPLLKHLRNIKLRDRIEQVVAPIDTKAILNDISFLKQNGGLLFKKSNYEVYLAVFEEIPAIMNEIGRLRELTYREIGEGTNLKLDLDTYDKYYNHLFVFDDHAKKIVGAYRLGNGHLIHQIWGKEGFYINSLFKLGNQLAPILSQTLELGRSFVVKEYQQKPMPLFLLWQGILHFVNAHDGIRYVMGPLSMSNSYKALSKDLMVSYIYRHHFNYELAKYVKPAKPYKIKSNAKNINLLLNTFGDDMVKLDRFISSVETNGLRVPVLLKQYIRQKAQILAFNVDPAFNNSLDALMLLNINDLPEETFSFLNSR